MAKEILTLKEEEIKNIKKGFSNQVYTDGCFCGHAYSQFRDDLHVFLTFSCRKSMMCDTSHYQVTSVQIVEPAIKYHSKERLGAFLKELFNNDDIEELKQLEGRDWVLTTSYYDEEVPEDIYLTVDGLQLDEESLKKIQKKLFKYYKNDYDLWSTAKFKDIGKFIYN